MSGFKFEKATKKNILLRLALSGPSGSGKTYSALSIAKRLAEQYGGRVALLDSENSSAERYADDFDFDHCNLTPPFSPARYVEALHAAVATGARVVVIDSLSHAWMGIGGALEMVDDAADRARQKAQKEKDNKFGAWREVTPEHNALVDAMLRCKAHLIVTMRSKTDYAQENGKVTKIGMQAIQREGLEYEFDVVGDMTMENKFVTSKTRCKALNKKVFQDPGAQVADILREWMKGEEDPISATSTESAPSPTKTPTAASKPTTSQGNGSNVSRLLKPSDSGSSTAPSNSPSSPAGSDASRTTAINSAPSSSATSPATTDPAIAYNPSPKPEPDEKPQGASSKTAAHQEINASVLAIDYEHAKSLDDISEISATVVEGIEAGLLSDTDKAKLRAAAAAAIARIKRSAA